jgi:RHS repeat-associated protein
MVQGFFCVKTGKVRAFMLGLPTKWGPYGLRMVLALLPIMFLLPVFKRIIHHSRQGCCAEGHEGHKGSNNHRLRSLLRQGLIITLAYLMLIDPAGLQQLAYASSQYSNITTGNWGSGNRTIEYAYDANGSCVQKVTKQTSTGDILETITYDYNIRNKLVRMTKEYTQDEDDIAEITEYTYNDDGDRVKSQGYTLINGGEPQDGWGKKFLIDPFNHTGYSQVLQTYDGSTSTTYTSADDVVTQSRVDYYGRVTSHILYDGHGSTRQLTNDTGDVEYDQVFNYDGYGVMLGYVGGEIYEQPLTSLLYAGEYFDTHLRQYNLRARWYDPLIGRFNQLDPFMGNTYDPQSLHKYLYAHANPINGIDPSGEMSGLELTVVTISIFLLLLAIPHFIAHTSGPKMKEDIGQMEGSQAVTFMSKGLREQMDRDILEAENPEVLNYNLEFWHEKAELNKAVTLYNAKTEMNLLRSIDATYHSLEIAGIGLGVAGGFAKTPIFWSKPHGGPQHWAAMQKFALEQQAKRQAKAIYTHHGLSTITKGQVTERLFPDVAEVMPSGKINITEFRYSEPLEHIIGREDDYRKALGHLFGSYDWKNAP